MEDWLAASWHKLGSYFWLPETPYLLAMAIALSVLVYLFRRDDRSALLHTLYFYFASLLALLVSALLAALDFATAAAVLREAAIIGGGIAIIRLWGLFIFRLLLRALHLEAPRIVEDIMVMLGYVAWGLVRLRYAGLDLSQIVTTSALITAVVAFSMQDTLGNLLGGVALELDSSLNVGDWVRIDDVEGQVVDIRWRSTSVQTRNGDTVVIPNSYLMRNRFAIQGRRRGMPLQRRRSVRFNVENANAPAKVIDAVQSAVRTASIANVAAEPAPDCVLMEFEHGYGHYALRYWLTDLARDDPTDSEVRMHILAALQRVGMRIAVPEFSIHTVKESEKRSQLARAREVERRLAALGGVNLFSGLSENERRTIAERLVYAPFARGDVLTRQGAVAHWLYMLTAGEVDVMVEHADGERQVVNRLSAGACFGEMGLLTGAPRTATVVAVSDVECYRLDKASLEDVLKSRPVLAEDFSRMLHARQSDTDRKLREATANQRSQRAASEGGDMLARIRGFFGLDTA